jgi:hypothetical protein
VSTGGHDRRSFFRELLRGASQAAREVDALRRLADDAVRQSTEHGDDPENALRPVPAPPATHLATPEELRSLSADLGRREWAEHALSLARTSVRLTPGAGRGSWLGGGPGVAGLEWPAWNGGELAFVARIGLTELPATPLPKEGALLVFFALDRAPSGLRPAEADACRVLHVADVPAGDAHEGALERVPVTPSAELTLPPVPARLDLDFWELEEWGGLRERLAGLQGVELEERASDYHALHRLLGEPDTFAVDMAVDAHLVSRGVDLEEDPYPDVLDEEVVAGAARWTLLVQLSNDDAVGIDVGELLRLFVWIHDDDLAAGRFDRVRAFVR